MIWQVQEAKNKLSQLVDDSLSKGPQIISRRGKNAVVVIGYDQYQKLMKPRKIFRDLVHTYKGAEMPEITRDKSPTGRTTPLDVSNFNI